MKLKKYWLKGGLIALIIAGVLSACLIIVASSAHDISDAYGPAVGILFNFFANVLLIAPLSAEGFSPVESIIVIGAYAFLIGSLIGWAYGKLRKHRS